MIFCRHRICRTKLKRPVSNKREAFCSRGCHTSFYLKRCLVCEDPLQRRNKTQKVCRKSWCRNAWRARAGFGRYCPSNSVSLASKTPGFIGSKPPHQRHRTWAQVAGPKLTSSQLHCELVGAVTPSPKPTRKIALTGVSTIPRRSFNPTIHPSTFWADTNFPMRQT